MIKYIIFIILFLISSSAYASMPTEQDRQDALSLMYTMGNAQEQHFTETSNYETIQAKWVNGLMPSVEAYSTLQGKGYVITITKVSEGKVWIIQRHIGPDTDVQEQTKEYWTCTNCAAN